MNKTEVTEKIYMLNNTDLLNIIYNMNKRMQRSNQNGRNFIFR